MQPRSAVQVDTVGDLQPGALTLQRQCDCGTHTSGGGECAACSCKKLQRKASNEAADCEAPESVHAARLLAAIEQYVRSRGRGRRPWENLFGYLRYATVELSTTRKEKRQEDRRTSGSLTPMSDAQCKPYAKQAEDAGKFGPAQPEPADASQCPRGDPHNAERFAKKCNYD